MRSVPTPFSYPDVRRRRAPHPREADLLRTLPAISPRAAVRWRNVHADATDPGHPAYRSGSHDRTRDLDPADVPGHLYRRPTAGGRMQWATRG